MELPQVILCVFIFGLQLVLPLWLVCVCVNVREVTSVGTQALTLHFVFSAVAVLPQTCSVGHWRCSAQPWPTCLPRGGCFLPCITCRICDSGWSHFWVRYTTVYIDETWYVWIWPLFAQVMFSEGNCIFFSWVRAEITDSQMRRGHSFFSLYQLFDWWIMDEAIDCLAQLCSTDPL